MPCPRASHPLATRGRTSRFAAATRAPRSFPLYDELHGLYHHFWQAHLCEVRSPHGPRGVHRGAARSVRGGLPSHRFAPHVRGRMRAALGAGPTSGTQCRRTW